MSKQLITVCNVIAAALVGVGLLTLFGAAGAADIGTMTLSQIIVRVCLGLSFMGAGAVLAEIAK